jgi:hypothetical protein
MKLMRLITATAFALLWAAGAMPALAQRFILIGQKQGSGGVTAGANSAWSVELGGGVYTYNPQVGLFTAVANAPVLTSISAGGGSAYQNDEVWGVSASNTVYRWNSSSQTFGGVFAPALLSITVGAGYNSCYPYEVWGIDTSHQNWRYNFCENDWYSYSYGETFNQIATAGGEVWGLNSSGNPLLFNPSSLQFAQLPGTFSQLAVGAGGVWAGGNLTSTEYAPYQFDPAAQSWYAIPSSPYLYGLSLAAGKEGIFFVDGSNHISRLNVSWETWSSVTNYDSDQLRGDSLTDGSGGGAWSSNTDDIYGGSNYGNIFFYVTY